MSDKKGERKKIFVDVSSGWDKDIQRLMMEQMLEKLPLDEFEEIVESAKKLLEHSSNKPKELIEKEKESLERLYKRLLKDAARYYIARARHIRACYNVKFHAPETHREEVQKYDRARRLQHNVVVDSLNILVRKFSKNNIDTSWREKLGGRRLVGEWAIALVQSIYEKIKRMENKGKNETNKTEEPVSAGI